MQLYALHSIQCSISQRLAATKKFEVAAVMNDIIQGINDIDGHSGAVRSLSVTLRHGKKERPSLVRFPLTMQMLPRLAPLGCRPLGRTSRRTTTFSWRSARRYITSRYVRWASVALAKAPRAVGEGGREGTGRAQIEGKLKN